MQKKLLILAVIALVLVGGVVFVWEKKNTQIVSQNQVNEEVSQELVMSVNSDGSKNYRSEKYGFEVTIPKEWKNFRNIEIEKRGEDVADINFLFETDDSRWFLEENCGGKCVKMFVISLVTHKEFNAYFDERWAITNKAGKPQVIGVSKKYVFFDAAFSSDPPSDLEYLNQDRVKVYRTIVLKDLKS